MKKTITRFIAVATLAFGGGLGVSLADFGADRESVPDHTDTPEWSDGYMHGYYHGSSDGELGRTAPEWLEDLRMD